MSIYVGLFKTIQDDLTVTVSFEDSRDDNSLYELLFAAESPVVISLDSEDNVYSPIKSKAATILIVSSTPYWNLYSSKWDGTKVMISKSSTGDIFFGYVTPALYNLEFRSDADVISIECIDPLASLKSIDYFQEQGEKRGRKTLRSILLKIFKKINILNVYFLNSITSIDASSKTLDTFILDDNNFYDDDEEEAAWTCYEVIYLISKFFGMTCSMTKYNQVFFFDIDSYRVYDGSNWYLNDNFTWLLTNTNTLSSLSVQPRDFVIDTTNIFGSDCNISLDLVYKKITVTANTKIEDESDDSEEDLYSPDGIITKYVNYLNGETFVYDNAVYVKVLKAKNWQQHIYAHTDCKLEGQIVELLSPYTPGDLVTRDYGNLNWMGSLLRTSGRFHWAHDLYGALLKCMVVNFKEDVKGEFSEYFALGFGFIAGEVYTDTGSNHSKKQSNYWKQMEAVYDDMQGKYDLMKYTSKKMRDFQNENTTVNGVGYYIVFNGTCRMTAITANGMLRNSNTRLLSTNYPVIYDENNIYWEKKLSEKFNDEDGGHNWYNGSELNPQSRLVVNLEIIDQLNNSGQAVGLMNIEGYGAYVIGYKLRIGDKWWDYLTNTWVSEETVSWMKIGQYSLLAESDMEITNNIFFANGIEESGWAIPVKNSDNLSGQVEFTFVNPRFPVPLSDVMKNHYREAFLPMALLIKDFHIDYLKCQEYGYWWKEEEDMTKDDDKSDKDNGYYYEIDDNFAQEGEEWDLKINTQNVEKDHSFSSVLYSSDGDVTHAVYLLKVINSCSSNSDVKLCEEWILDKLGRHYRSPKKIINMTVRDFIDVRRPVYYETATHMRCAVLSESYNVRSGENTVSFTEIE